MLKHNFKLFVDKIEDVFEANPFKSEFNVTNLIPFISAEQDCLTCSWQK